MNEIRTLNLTQSIIETTETQCATSIRHALVAHFQIQFVYYFFFRCAHSKSIFVVAHFYLLSDSLHKCCCCASWIACDSWLNLAWTNGTKHLNLMNTSNVKCIFKLQTNWNTRRTYALTVVVWLCTSLSINTQLSSNITITPLKRTHWLKHSCQSDCLLFFQCGVKCLFCASLFVNNQRWLLDKPGDENSVFLAFYQLNGNGNATALVSSLNRKSETISSSSLATFAILENIYLFRKCLNFFLHYRLIWNAVIRCGCARSESFSHTEHDSQLNRPKIYEEKNLVVKRFLFV